MSSHSFLHPSYSCFLVSSSFFQYALSCQARDSVRLKDLWLHFFCSLLQPFHPMVNLVCSADLRMFLCALYSPVCTEYGRVSMPCRGLCQRAKDECNKLMEVFGLAWPEDIECSRCVYITVKSVLAKQPLQIHKYHYRIWRSLLLSGFQIVTSPIPVQMTC